jgi:hypothetical protein
MHVSNLRKDTEFLTRGILYKQSRSINKELVAETKTWTPVHKDACILAATLSAASFLFASMAFLRL